MKKILFPLWVSAALFSADAMKAQTVLFQDNFDSYTDFAIANVGSWTLTDVDQLSTYGFQSINFPNGGVAKSFQVFNSTTTTPPMTPTSTSDWTGHSGDKMMVSFAAVSAPWNNDWLISPQMTVPEGEGATLSFFAKSCDSDYGAE
ncbi:T9SS C-terminal target domain-containing protein, partial [Chryseobacterium sp. SC28]